jgi:hypothetical protein
MASGSAKTLVKTDLTVLNRRNCDARRQTMLPLAPMLEFWLDAGCLKLEN